jgi:uncharacterized membrane protein
MARSIVSLGSLVLVVALAAVACGGEDASGGVEVGSGDITASKGADKARSCSGSEPFWKITIDEKSVKWEEPGGATRTIENLGPKGAMNTPTSTLALYQGRTAEDSGRFMNVIIEDAGPTGCSDDSSEVIHPYSVKVLSGTELHIGCCK